jgi:hypothetical protein
VQIANLSQQTSKIVSTNNFLKAEVSFEVNSIV